MTFLQPQPEGSKIFIFIKKLSHHLLKNYPSTFWKYQKISQLVLEISKNYPKYVLELSEIYPMYVLNLLTIYPLYVFELSKNYPKYILELLNIYPEYVLVAMLTITKIKLDSDRLPVGGWGAQSPCTLQPCAVQTLGESPSARLPG